MSLTVNVCFVNQDQNQNLLGGILGESLKFLCGNTFVENLTLSFGKGHNRTHPKANILTEIKKNIYQNQGTSLYVYDQNYQIIFL